MKRSNFVIGLGLSVLLHAALLYMLLGGPTYPAPMPAPPIVTPIQIASIDPQDKLHIEPVATEPVPMITTPQTTDAPLETPPPAPAKPARVPLPLERVVEPTRGAPQRLASLSEPVESQVARPAPEPAAAASPIPAPTMERTAALDEAVSRRPAAPSAPAPVVDHARPVGHELEGTGDFTPPLRVHWRNARELVAVARTLGMRLAAVDDRGDIIGEVALTQPPSLKAWHGLPYGYSNRVRMLSPSIFSSRIGDADGVQVREIWVFVPADRDRAMVNAQKEAVRRAGARLEDVTSVDGQFVRAANGSYRLDITNIRWRNPRERS
jgi:hypothetical protein